MKNPTEYTQWHKLAAHYDADVSSQHMRDWFANDPLRFSRFSLQASEIFLDYSRNRINENTIALLCDLANELGLAQKIDALFSGQPINVTENRPALHTALRTKQQEPLLVNGKDILSLISETQKRLYHFVTRMHSKQILGITGKPIAHIINIGIGGSDLGCMMSTHALKDFAVADLKFHFISTVDRALIDEVLAQIDPETSLFIISSKSFSTLETLTNARTIAAWLQNKLGKAAIAQHFIAITEATEKAVAFGIVKENIFPLWDWVGGRYSIWSAIGLPLMLMIGMKQFDEFLSGAYEMDQHFRHTEFAKNMPVLLALLGIWYMNFVGAKVQSVTPYSHRLRYLVPYLQQVEMESNGKGIGLQGNSLGYATSPVIFGGEGCNVQHSYVQLLHQGQHLIPIDFILIGKYAAGKTVDPHQDILIASGLAQAQALMCGKTYNEAYSELISANYSATQATQLAHHRVLPGNRPSNILFLERITPKSLGALLALYEHKIFVQGAIWNINSFDQWGVELGKQLLPNFLQHVQRSQQNQTSDSLIENLIAHFKNTPGKL